jgi:hypothetical protein
VAVLSGGNIDPVLLARVLASTCSVPNLKGRACG